MKIPVGKNHRFSLEEHKMAEHVIQTEIARGFSEQRAEEIAWARVNEMRKKHGINE